MKTPLPPLTRRAFLAAAASSLALRPSESEAAAEKIIDIHQHTNYSGRTDEQMIAHQRKMGITKTILLPAGSKYGLAAGAGGNDTVVAVARRLPKEYVYFANELPDIPETRSVIEKYLKMHALGIGEQKFHVDCDSPPMQLIAEIAQQFHVPVLMHFQHDTYNLHIERFHTMLEKYPKVNFIAHAQTFWANIDKNCDQVTMYPKGKVTPGGISDRLLSDYPNFYGDLSAGSGLNALQRDEDHARGFLERHQDKLIYGSDCSDPYGEGEKCSGSQQIATIRRLVPDRKIREKLFYRNAMRVIKVKL
ncbi:MAG TPA: amidohydrolase family protein [Bryobacterales bacterium]|nr:amidohydrolase family protein [Bryobacterales bacterium]